MNSRAHDCITTVVFKDTLVDLCLGLLINNKFTAQKAILHKHKLLTCTQTNTNLSQLVTYCESDCSAHGNACELVCELRCLSTTDNVTVCNRLRCDCLNVIAKCTGAWEAFDNPARGVLWYSNDDRAPIGYSVYLYLYNAREGHYLTDWHKLWGICRPLSPLNIIVLELNILTFNLKIICKIFLLNCILYWAVKDECFNAL